MVTRREVARVEKRFDGILHHNELNARRMARATERSNLKDGHCMDAPDRFSESAR